MPLAALLLVLALAAPVAAAVPALQPLPGLDSRAVRNALLEQDGVLYVGGDFTQVGGQPRSGLAAIDLRSGQLLAWAPQLSSPTCAALAWKDGVLYVGGAFHGADGQDQPYLAAFNDARSGPAHLQAQWRPELDAPVADLLPGPGGTLYVAGRFEEVAGRPRHGLVQLQDALHGSGEPTALRADFDKRVCSLALDPAQPGVLYAAGLFQHVGADERPLLARLDARTGQLLPGRLQVQGGRSQEALRLLYHQGALYAAGVEIDSVNGQPRRNAFACDPADLSLKPWRADLDAGAGALSARGPVILLGGDFRHVNGLARRVAKVDAQSGAVLPWDPQPDHNTYAALLLKDRCVLSGYWTHLGGFEAQRLAALVEEDDQEAPAPSLAWALPIR